MSDAFENKFPDRESYKIIHELAWNKSFPNGKLQDGEQLMFVSPARDFRGGADADLGQHSAELIMAKRQGDIAISVTFFTGWHIDRKPTLMDGHEIDLMCTGLYTHDETGTHVNKDYAYHTTDCSMTESGECYGELGSALYGDVLLQRLVTEGSWAIWEEIDEALKEAHNG